MYSRMAISFYCNEEVWVEGNSTKGPQIVTYDINFHFIHTRVYAKTISATFLSLLEVANQLTFDINYFITNASILLQYMWILTLNPMYVKFITVQLEFLIKGLVARESLIYY